MTMPLLLYERIAKNCDARHIRGTVSSCRWPLRALFVDTGRILLMHALFGVDALDPMT